MITPYVITLLLAQSSVSSVVGDKIFDKEAPQRDENNPETLPPYLVVKQTAGEHIKHTGGRDGTAWADVLITTYGSRTAQADDLMQAVGNYLDGLRPGTVTPVTGPAAFLKGIIEQPDEEEDEIPPILNEAHGTPTASATFKVWYTDPQ